MKQWTASMKIWMDNWCINWNGSKFKKKAYYVNLLSSTTRADEQNRIINRKCGISPNQKKWLQPSLIGLGHLQQIFNKQAIRRRGNNSTKEGKLNIHWNNTRHWVWISQSTIPKNHPVPARWRAMTNSGIWKMLWRKSPRQNMETLWVGGYTPVKAIMATKS